MNFVLTCAPGLESILKKEVEIAGYKIIGSQPTFVRFQGDLSAIARMNIRSRVWNKLFLEIKQYQTPTFDTLFDMVQTIDRGMYIQNNPIIVTAQTRYSVLTSTPTIQSITKKSIVKKLLNKVERLKDGKMERWMNDEMLFEDPNLQPVEILVHIENDMCSILLNTTGESLHKRGYKQLTGDAPINESLAAGLVLLSWWKFSEPLYDFFCGSGTIVIEAALLAKNMAPAMAGKPGSFRKFAFQSFARYDQTLFTAELKAAKAKMMTGKKHTIIASDIDPKMIAMAKENAKNAGVEEYISFITKDVADYINGPELIGALVSNPPYGLRMNIYDIENIHHTLTEIFTQHPKLHGWIITTYDKFVTDTKSWSWKKTMFLNGGERCWFYKKTLLK